MSGPFTTGEETFPIPSGLVAELLFEQPPAFDIEAIASRIRSRLPRARLDAGGGDTPALAHEDHPVTLKDGRQTFAQFAVTRSEVLTPDRIRPALRQTWDWEQGKAQAGRYRHTIVASDMLATGLHYKERFRLFANSLLGVIEATRPIAVFSHHGQRLVDPAAMVRASGDADPMAMLMCHLNVRVFKITTGQKGDALMDTRGLAALGLPDVQMRFRRLDGRHVASVLYAFARNIYDCGGFPFDDGHTMTGIKPGESWTFRRGMAAARPARLVMDIEPAPAHAVGRD